MLRYVLLLAVAVLSLSCASSGGKEADPSPDTYVAEYEVRCGQAGCLYEVSYRGAEGTVKEQSQGNWSHSFYVAPGEQLVLTVRRRDDANRGQIYARIKLNGRDLKTQLLEPGQAEPVTLSAQVM